MSDTGGREPSNLTNGHRVDEQVQTDNYVIMATASSRQQINRDAQLENVINRAHIDDETHILACDYLNYRLRRVGFIWSNCPALSAEPSRLCLSMRTLADEFERRYSEVFRDMTASLEVTPLTAYSTFLNVCDELFRGENDQLEVKWGRVVALFAFAGALAVQCVEKEMPQQVSNIAEWVTRYTQTHLSNWIDSHGGWNGFLQFYDKADGEEKWSSFKKVMTGFGVACGAVGVATLASMLAGRP